MTQPHRSRIMTVEPQWIDYNRHLNMAYYNVLFDRGAFVRANLADWHCRPEGTIGD